MQLPHPVRLARTTAILLTALAVLAGCASKDQPETSAAAPTTLAKPKEREAGPARSGGALTIGISGETDSFNPFAGTWSIPSFEVANAVFEPLAAVDESGIARPYLAESITPNGDFTEWTITVRPNVSFHNGEKFDTAALKKNLDTAKKSGLTAQVFLSVDSIDVISDTAVRVKMSRPWATFPATLAMQAGYMAAPAMLDDPAGANAIPIGTGPFIVQSRVRDASVKTKRNPRYWRTDAKGYQLPYLDAVDFEIISDSTSRGNAIAAGNVDAIDALTPDTLKAQADAAARGEVQLITNTGQEGDETILTLNTSREPFDDPIARQILAYAIDQKKVANAAYHDVYPAAWGMFEEGSPYYVSREKAGYPEPDVVKARQLAQQYQQAHGKTLEFTTLVPPDPQYLTVGQVLQQELADVGVTLNLQAIEQTQLARSVVLTGDYQASGFVLRSSPSPDQSYIFLATKANPNGLSVNMSRYDDADLTAAMNDFRAAAEPAKRVDAIAKVQQSLAKNMQIIFLVHARNGFVYDNQVHGMQAATYPGTDKPAFSPYANTPFYTFAWKDAG